MRSDVQTEPGGAAEDVEGEPGLAEEEAEDPVAEPELHHVERHHQRRHAQIRRRQAHQEVVLHLGRRDRPLNTSSEHRGGQVLCGTFSTSVLRGYDSDLIDHTHKRSLSLCKT